jgi:cytochrome oxidase Cu insertion factor (SCO1/SenC/PrrC family)
MKLPANTTIIALCVAVTLLVAAVLGYVSVTSSRGPTGGSGVAAIGGPFTLVNQDGKTVTEADFKGKYMLIYFGFTYCPDVCPTTLTVMSDALNILGSRADKVVPMLITVDPERDTPDHLRMYVGYFHPRMQGLSGSPEQVAQAAKTFRVYYAKVPNKETNDPDMYTMDHSSIVYFMGPDGRFLTHFGHDVDAKEMAAKMKGLL